MSGKFIHLDLFSGIGGFAYAVDEVWSGAEHIFCDNNWFCQAVLEKVWKGAIIYNDIRTLSRERLTSNSHDRRPPVSKEQTTGDKQCRGGVDLLTGGFPCQPFSQAGKRKGKDDDRYLWPEMLRVIREFRPTWIIGENVDGLTTMVKFESELEVDDRRYTEKEMADGSFGVGEVRGRWGEGILDEIVADIKSVGYEVQPFIIPACAVGAPHRRDRIWIVARSNTERPGCDLRLDPGKRSAESRELPPQNRQQGQRSGIGIGSSCANASDPQGIEQRGCASQECGDQFSRRVQQKKQTGNNAWGKGKGCSGDANNSINKGLERYAKLLKERKISELDTNHNWRENWIEVATRLCTLDDGLSRKLVRLPNGRKISYSKWRQEALKAAGNAIVPQVAIEIMRAIKAVG